MRRAALSCGEAVEAGDLPFRGEEDVTAVSYWKVIMSVRLSVGAFGFKGSFVRLPLP